MSHRFAGIRPGTATTPVFFRRRGSVVLSLLMSWLVASMLVGCGTEADTPKPVDTSDLKQGLTAPTGADYQATIRWTEHGVPHITGATLPDAIYGQAYANAKLNLCTFADIVLMGNSERSRYLGEGKAGAWVESDFAHLALGVRQRAITMWPKLSESGRQALIAYAAGYNHYLAATPVAKRPARCGGADWVKPISAVDLLTWYNTLALLAGNRNFAKYVGLTNPPTIDTTDASTPNARAPNARTPNARTQADWLGRYTDYASDVVRRRVFGMPQSEAIGSNGWALGSERSDSGKGMVLANPHFPWFGELRFYENHLTVTDDPDAGAMDVYGASLLGVPGIEIGFTQGFGWTHTVSFSSKFTFYKLKLKKGDPFTYVVDGQDRKITGSEVSIEVKQADGSFKTLKRTYYRSEVGVMAALPAVGEWTADSAFTIRDANENNFKMIDHFLAMDQAQSVADAKRVLAEVQAMPWVNLIGADATGQAVYSDACSEPFLSKEALAAHAKKLADGDFLTDFAFGLGAFLLDGSKGYNDWQVDPDGAREAGLVPCNKVPNLERKDYVANANESHWLTNASAPLTGFAAIFGPEKTVRSLRTRMNLRLLTDLSKDGLYGADGKLSLAELQSAVNDGWAMSAVLLRDDVVSLCQSVTAVTIQDEVVDIQPACKVLADWDGRFRADSRGAVLFREWFTAFSNPDDSKALWVTPFDVADPVKTPKTLKISKPKTPEKSAAALVLGRAVLRLKKANIPLDAALSTQQYTMKDKQRIGVPGASHREGALNLIGWSKGRDSTSFAPFNKPASVNGASGLTEEGYPVNYGSSFMMALQFTDKGPQARTLVTFSQSAEPDSPWFSDQTPLFAKQAWKTVRFTSADIDADPKLVTESLPLPVSK